MSIETRCYEKVDSIQSSGLYFLAEGPLTRPFADQPRMPDGTPVEQNILGSMPNLEAPVRVGIVSRFPSLLIARVVIGQETPESFAANNPELEYSEWFGQSGILDYGSEDFWTLWSSIRTCFSANCMSISLRDMKKPQNSNMFKFDQIPNGYMNVHVDEKSIGERGHYWRGRVEIKGDNPSVVVQQAINDLNVSLQENNTPIWRVNQSRL